MKHYWFRNRKRLTLIPLMLFLMAVVACGTAAPEASEAPGDSPN